MPPYKETLTQILFSCTYAYVLSFNAAPATMLDFRWFQYNYFTINTVMTKGRKMWSCLQPYLPAVEGYNKIAALVS